MNGKTWIRRLSIFVGAFGGVGGVVVAAWEISALAGSYEPELGAVSERGTKALLVVALVLFGIAVVAAVLGLWAPRVCGLALIVCGGVSLALVLYGAAALFWGGLYLVPFGFLVLCAGVATVVLSGHRSRSRQTP